MNKLATLTIAFGLAALVPGCADHAEESILEGPSGAKADNPNNALCQQIRDDAVDIDEVGEGDVLTKEIWKTIDVIVEFPFDECQDAIGQTQLEINGELYWQFTSHEDSCDGGNTYGAIYTEDLQTPVAHIYDGDIVCDGWREEARAEKHACDLAAEELAEAKMNAFGLPFEATSSSLEIRDPFVFSYIHVNGVLPDAGDKEATVRVLMNLDSCTPGSTTIESLRLD